MIGVKAEVETINMIPQGNDADKATKYLVYSSDSHTDCLPVSRSRVHTHYTHTRSPPVCILYELFTLPH